MKKFKKYNVKDIFNMKKNTKVKIGVLVFVCLVLGISVFQISRGLLLEKEYTEEIKSVEIKSDGWDKSEAGAWKVTKSANWTGANKAQVTFNLNTVEKTYIDKPTNKDIVLVLDVSGSMKGNKLNQAKSDIKALVSSLANIGNNTFSLITFSNDSNVKIRFSSDKAAINSSINSLSANGGTNYNAALISVGELLKGYSNRNRDLIVLFITDGYPTSEGHAAQYTKLKKQYSYAKIIGIQYELGTEIVPGLKQVSDVQYSTNMQTLNEVMYIVSGIGEAIENYVTFDIIDYISEYFDISSVNDIRVSTGTVTFEEETKKILWHLENFRTGRSANMTINVTLKEPYSGENGYYPTNDGEDINSKLESGKTEEKKSTLTPVLKNYYTVSYDTNIPAECGESKLTPETHFVYETVIMREDELFCSGYNFKGWEITDETSSDIKKINSDTFIMPLHDVMIRGVWGTLDISKDIEGKVANSVCKKFNLTGEIGCVDNLPSGYVSSASGINFTLYSSETNGRGLYIYAGTENNTYPIYYYRGAVTNNNVLFAGFCWKIVRTTDTGGVKLIYNGPQNEGSSEGICNSASGDTVIGYSVFNPDDARKYLGYTYDTNTSSTVKTYIDDWYRINIQNKGYSGYLEDTIWCNDWSTDINSLSVSNNRIYYGFGNRSYIKQQKPIISCPQKENSYTVSTSNGNGKLAYPIALLTGDEVQLAGYAWAAHNINGSISDTYINSGQNWWLLSPESSYTYSSSFSNASVVQAYPNGTFSSYVVDGYGGVNSGYKFGVRPSLSLKSGIRFTTNSIGEEGSVGNPYIVE